MQRAGWAAREVDGMRRAGRAREGGSPGVNGEAVDLPLSGTPCDGRSVCRSERRSDFESESAGGRSVSTNEGVVCGSAGEREGASGKGAQHLPQRGSLRACDSNKHASTASVLGASTTGCCGVANGSSGAAKRWWW